MKKAVVKNKKYLLIILVVFLFDLFTKLIASILLPFHQEVSIIGDELYFYLTYNIESIGAQSASGETPNLNLILFLNSFTSLCLGLYILGISKVALRKVWKITYGIALYLIMLTVISLLSNNLSDLQLPNQFISWFTKINTMFLYFSIFWVIKDEKLKVLIAIIMGCGLGNLLNHFYPPYYVIDFLYSAHLNQWLNMGIFNMADIMLNLMYIAICGYLLFLLITKLLERSSRQKAV